MQSRTIQTPQQQMNERQAVLEQRKRINALLVDHQLQLRLKAAQTLPTEAQTKQVNPQ